jgi:DNA (cytosine-5)-methyltransferase 1
MNTLKAVSLFSGLGGMDLGLIGGFDYLGKIYDPNKVNIVYAMDFDQHACRIYNENFTHECKVEDVKELKESDVPDHDILIGGFPCQSFSVVAQNPKRLGFKDDRGKLFFEMCRILKKKQPRFFVAENVKGILSVNNKEAFPLIIKEFKKSGYYVKSEILNSVNFGIPQKRERVFIVGFRNEYDFLKFEFPSPITLKSFVPIRKILESENKIDEKYYFSDKAITGLKKTKHYKSMNKGRAQDIEAPCNTVGAHLAKVSLNSTDPVLCISGRYRMFTPREVARIQSFPESFKLSGSKTINYKALGNAVAPLVMWYLTQQILKL